MTVADYRPYWPQRCPVEVDDGIWTVEGATVPYAVGPFVVPCPTRSTLLAEPSGSLWLHSPIAYSADLHARIAALGPISGLIAPNTFHYLYLDQWAERVPAAKVVLAPGLEHRFAHLGQRVVQKDSPWIDADPSWLSIEPLIGGKWSELVFIHRDSRSVIVTDLVQNFELSRIHDWRAKLLLGFSGAGRRPVVSIELLFMAWRAGKLDAIRQTLAKLRQVPLRRLLIAHGAQPSTRQMRRMGWNITEPGLQ